MPLDRPPPPQGDHHRRRRAELRFDLDADVPCPSITSTSSKLGTKVGALLRGKPCADFLSAFGSAIEEDDLEPAALVPSTFTAGASRGMTMVASMPSARAARATPCA